jgi:redox-sensing transcriptional repressor
MPNQKRVSISVIRRLPRYYRFLGALINNGITRISSMELSHLMGLTASQIRQDLNCFGGFGQQGYGYNTALLREKIGVILGIPDGKPIIIIGAGNIGRAVTLNMDFDSLGFKLVGIFDKSEKIIGTEIKGLTVQNISNLENFCLEHHPQVAVLTIPTSAAPDVVERIVNLGIAGVWNFSHYDFSIKHPNLAVENVHLGDSLMTLSYLVSAKLNDKDDNNVDSSDMLSE